jgi:hypothetical protein
MLEQLVGACSHLCLYPRLGGLGGGAILQLHLALQPCA